MYIYVRIYMCIVHMRAYALCVCIYTYARLSTFTYACIRTRVCLHIGVYVHVYMCTYAYIGVYTHMYTYTRIRPAFGFYNQDCKTLQFKFQFSSAENVRVCVLRMYAYVHVYNGAYYIRVRFQWNWFWTCQLKRFTVLSCWWRTADSNSNVYANIYVRI